MVTATRRALPALRRLLPRVLGLAVVIIAVANLIDVVWPDMAGHFEVLALLVPQRAAPWAHALAGPVAVLLIGVGWSLVALALGVDTSTPAGRVVIQTLGAAGHERRMIGARTRDALAVKRAQGVRLGKPSRAAAAARRRIRDVHAQGWTWQRIADLAES